MESLFSFLLLILLFPLSLLPLPILYALCYILVYIPLRCLGYRRGVIVRNLSKSFPQKTEKEIQRIASRYYFHLSHIVAESLWIWTATNSQKRCHCQIGNMEMLNNYGNRSVIVLLGHYGNWEFLKTYTQSDAVALLGPQYGSRIAVAYKEPERKLSAKLFYQLRKYKDMRLVESQTMARFMFSQRHSKWIYNMIADQSPLDGSRFLTRFLNQDTLWMNGPEVLARQFDCVVVYLCMERVGLGRYRCIFKEITSKAGETGEGFITSEFSRLLEQDICRRPEIWLWSHRRWKRSLDSMRPSRPEICRTETDNNQQ